MTFQEVREFLTSWGMHFDTPEGESNDIPYPQVYIRMRDSASHRDPTGKLGRFISLSTDTTDSRTYLTFGSWDQMEESWNDFK